MIFKKFYWPLKLVAFGIICVLVFMAIRSVIIAEIQKATKPLQKEIAGLKTAIDSLEYKYKYRKIELPKTIDFCGERVFLYSYSDSLLLWKAMSFFLDRFYQTSLLLSAINYYLPWNEAILEKDSLPLDLKLVPVVESNLDPQAQSWAKALGYWQFVPSTGRQRKLVINEDIDQRRDPILSTKAAAEHFSYLYKLFGNWQLALAAYNAGENNIKKAQKKQGYQDYTLLYLNNETRNYVFMILAFKIIYDNPEKYGFHLADHQKFAPLVFDTVTVDVGKKSLTFSKIAQICNVPVQVMREFNPAFIKNMIPKGKWMIRLPSGKRQIFLTKYPQYG